MFFSKKITPHQPEPKPILQVNLHLQYLLAPQLNELGEEALQGFLYLTLGWDYALPDVRKKFTGSLEATLDEAEKFCADLRMLNALKEKKKIVTATIDENDTRTIREIFYGA